MHPGMDFRVDSLKHHGGVEHTTKMATLGRYCQHLSIEASSRPAFAPSTLSIISAFEFIEGGVVCYLVCCVYVWGFSTAS